MNLRDYKKIAIICDGTEVSYGMTLLHLFKYEDEKQDFLSKKGEIIVPELYSTKAFERANVKNGVFKIFYGKAGKASEAIEFNRFGITIGSMKDGLVCVGPQTELNDKDYNSFIKLANDEMKKYEDTESEYSAKVPSNWITSDFTPVEKAGLFGKKDAAKKKKQQYYDFLSLCVYNELLLG